MAGYGEKPASYFDAVWHELSVGDGMGSEVYVVAERAWSRLHPEVIHLSPGDGLSLRMAFVAVCDAVRASVLDEYVRQEEILEEDISHLEDRMATDEAGEPSGTELERIARQIARLSEQRDRLDAELEVRAQNAARLAVIDEDDFAELIGDPGVEIAKARQTEITLQLSEARSREWVMT